MSKPIINIADVELLRLPTAFTREHNAPVALPFKGRVGWGWCGLGPF